MKRTLGNEITHLFSPNINVCYGLSVNREFTAESIQTAITTICKRHPLLLATFKSNADGEWFYADGGMVETQFLNKKIALTDWYIENDGIPLDWRKSLLKIGVFIGNGVTDIMLLGHHIIGDGMGYMNLTKDLLSALDDKLSDDIFILPNENSIKNIGNGGLLMKLFANFLNKKWLKSGKQFSYDDYAEFFRSYRKSNPPSVYLANVSSVNVIRAACKKSGITVNEAFSMAFVFALSKLGRKGIRLGCAANIRNEMQYDVSKVMGNFTTGIATVVNSPEEVPQKLREKLNNPKYRCQVIQLLNLLDRSLISSTPFAVYGDYNNATAKQLGRALGEQRKNKAFGISNLGVQRFDTYSFKASVQFIGPAFPQNFLTVGIITVDNTAQLTLRYSTVDLSEKQVADLFGYVEDYLEKFVKDGCI